MCVHETHAHAQVFACAARVLALRVFSEAEGELQADGTGRLLLLERKAIGTIEKSKKKYKNE